MERKYLKKLIATEELVLETYSPDKSISSTEDELSWEPDVEFVCHDSTSGQTKRLYASSAILARRSPYYKTSMPLV